ncbi:MAG: hypothetical protein R3F41_14485 [Gammaproteobacteria bacterium]|nr:hypothetical protein [Pseudomonadales bacterium]MCP5347185.1 hypothetical protein [Pseudomonadales bacterium]
MKPVVKTGGSTLSRYSLLAVLGLAATYAIPQLNAQSPDSGIPDLDGVWDGGGRARPVNGVNMPWTSENFPVLNERAQAYQQAFEEIMAPKYDCQPASSPAIQYDPYHFEVTQWPDRVLFRYEKDDQLRTVWLDGRQPTSLDYSIQGFSSGHYEADALVITTTHFVFDITGFDDYNGIPSSSQKIVTERYWRDGDDLRATVTVEDPMFLREPASYTTRWVPARNGYKLAAYDCDPEAARASVRFYPSKYK